MTELIQKCIANDRAAQNEFYKKHNRKVYAACRQYSNNTEDAEDTLIESFVKIFTKLHHYKGKGSLEGWMRKIAVNTALEKFGKKRIKAFELSEDKHPSITNEVYDSINTRDLLKLVETLPPVTKMVFKLYVLDGETHKQIGERLGISIGTSKSNLHDAREILKKRLNKQ